MKITNPKHQIPNKFEYQNSKFKTTLSKESFTKERFRSFCHWNFGNLVLFRISDLGFRIYMDPQGIGQLRRYGIEVWKREKIR